MPKRLGRPRELPHSARPLSVRVTPAENRAIRAAARRAGLSLSDWIRAVLITDPPDVPEIPAATGGAPVVIGYRATGRERIDLRARAQRRGISRARFARALLVCHATS